jgi:type II secretory pathway predicted ATPase ExeA
MSERKEKKAKTLQHWNPITRAESRYQGDCLQKKEDMTMSETYKAFFGFNKDPFITNIHHKDILVTQELEAAAERIAYTVRLGAVALITGEVGAGKSTALRWALENFHPSEYKTLWVTATSGSILEFYRQLLRELDNDASSMSKAFCTRVIRKEVRELIQEKGQKPIVIIDEASLLRLDVLVELHTITQFDGDSKPWLPIILAGQMNLEEKLRYRKAAPLASRVVARGVLSAVMKEEMDQYLNHHLHISGVKTALFTDPAMVAIHQGSGGIYRKANNLARGALIAAAGEKSSQVTPDHVRIASSEIF